ncbi:universal stress protein [Wenzhouxiangella marina]|uniref:Universal stress protein n=1 Tax=Wenzhouxiangella marina TaxID=1579979 RepID=A0A0K0XY27_9GAMM|nr:universal stress protein [Wenzhouxiangella marina]AKS42516.1 Universal stress protein [Wenzhouxiangella marina]MBB6085707.1 nucleotide-binding universal stress UspA family protein [Wenzhouxiangella marina]
MSTRILVGLDGSPSSRKALDHAIGLAAGASGRLHLVAVACGPDIEMADPDEREILLERARQRCDEHLNTALEATRSCGLEVESHLMEGQPAEQLLGLARKLGIEHIVLGHRRKGLFEQMLMGSVAKRVVDFAPCTVTIVR